MNERKDALHEGLDMKKVRADMFTRIAVVLVVLCLLVTMVAMVIGIFQARDQARANGQLSTDVLATQELLISCTSPEGECYKEGQQRTAEIVAGINMGANRAAAAALVCRDRGVVRFKPMVRCIERVVAENAR